MSATCPVCRAGPVARRTVGARPVLACTRCGFGRLVDARGTDDYWERGHDLDRESTDPYWTTARTSVFAAALARLAGQVEGRTLVDLGGGVGHFAACARDRGWDAYSLDVSPAARALAAARLGPDRALDTLPGTLVGRCDVVTMWCVVAHVADPRPLLAQAAAALRPGGRLLVTTPNFRFQAGYARFLALGGRRLDFLAHDHLLHFTDASLRLLLRQAGFEAARVAYIGVTEDCLADRRLATTAVPAKRLWNRATVGLARLGLPLLCSELQVIATSTHAAVAVPAR